MFNGDLCILQSNEDSIDSSEVKNNVPLDGVQNTNKKKKKSTSLDQFSVLSL